MRLTTAIVAFALSATAVAAEEEQYICLAEQATGFVAENGNWRETRFRTNRRFLVTLDKSNLTGSTSEFGGGPFAFENCDVYHSGFVRCLNSLGAFEMSAIFLRYTRTYRVGFTSGRDEGGDTPMIEIGTCSKL